MQIIKTTPFELALVTPTPGDEEQRTTLVVKATFALAPAGTCKLAPQQTACSADVHHEADGAGSLRYPSDFVQLKPRAECVLAGTCHVPRGEAVPVSGIAFRVGNVTKTLAVFGEREWTKRLLFSRISSPKPFTRMPLRWERAFGGPGHPTNPFGVGLRSSAKGEKHLLPNLEDPQRLIAELTDEPPPAGCFPRARRPRDGRGPTAAAAERGAGGHNSAPQDQQISGYWRGDEEIALRNLHAKHELLKTRLPGVRARCFLDSPQLGEGYFREVTVFLDTIVVDADALLVHCLFRAPLGAAGEALPADARLFVTHDASTTPRSLEECYASLVAASGDDASQVTTSAVAATGPRAVRRRRAGAAGAKPSAPIVAAAPAAQATAESMTDRINRAVAEGMGRMIGAGIDAGVIRSDYASPGAARPATARSPAAAAARAAAAERRAAAAMPAEAAPTPRGDVPPRAREAEAARPDPTPTVRPAPVAMPAHEYPVAQRPDAPAPREHRSDELPVARPPAAPPPLSVFATPGLDRPPASAAPPAAAAPPAPQDVQWDDTLEGVTADRQASSADGVIAFSDDLIAGLEAEAATRPAAPTSTSSSSTSSSGLHAHIGLSRSSPEVPTPDPSLPAPGAVNLQAAFARTAMLPDSDATTKPPSASDVGRTVVLDQGLGGATMVLPETSDRTVVLAESTDGAKVAGAADRAARTHMAPDANALRALYLKSLQAAATDSGESPAAAPSTRTAPSASKTVLTSSPAAPAAKTPGKAPIARTVLAPSPQPLAPTEPVGNPAASTLADAPGEDEALRASKPPAPRPTQSIVRTMVAAGGVAPPTPAPATSKPARKAIPRTMVIFSPPPVPPPDPPPASAVARPPPAIEPPPPQPSASDDAPPDEWAGATFVFGDDALGSTGGDANSTLKINLSLDAL